SFGGLYLLPGSRGPRTTREDIATALSKELHTSRSFKEALELLRGQAELGFSYTKQSAATVLYVKALIALALRAQSSGTQFVAVVKDFPELDPLRLPPNLKLIKAPSLPFEISKALIKRATLPIMTTGDVSFSLATEYRTPQFYEMNGWKRGSAQDFAQV